MHGMITHTSEWNNEVGQSAWKEARYSRLFFFLSLDLKLVVPLKKSNRQHGLLYQKGALFGFKLHFSHTSGVVSEIYPYAVCIDFRGFLFMDVKKEEVKKKKKAHFLLWAGSAVFRNDELGSGYGVIKGFNATPCCCRVAEQSLCFSKAL